MALPDQPGPTLAAPSPAVNVATVSGFDGINAGQSSCGCRPPDGAVAVGPTHVVGAVNTAYAVWDKAGNAHAGYPKSLSSLFSANPACLMNISDPFAEYDRASARFVLGALTYDAAFNSIICVAVSQTGNPDGLWNVYGFPGSQPSELLDFPHMTISAVAIYVSVNRFDESNPSANPIPFLGARVYAYNKSQMYAGQPASVVFYNAGNTQSGKVADTLSPVRGAPPSGAAYFIAADNELCPCSKISVWAWTDPFGASLFVLRGDVGVSAYNQPPNAPQLGGHGKTAVITTNDSANLGAYWFGGTIYGAHAVGYDTASGVLFCSTQPPPQPCVATVQWYQIGSLNTPSLIQQGITDPADGHYRFFPNLSVDSAGNLFIGYAESSANTYAGVAYAARAPSDAVGTLQPEVVLKPGGGTLDPSDRYGDYAGEALDPNGCTVWHLEEYAPPQPGPIWGTWVSSVRFPACANARVGGIAEEPYVPSAASSSGSDRPTARALAGAAFAAIAGITGYWWVRRKRAP